MRQYYTSRKYYESGYCIWYSYVDETNKKNFFKWLEFLKENIILDIILEDNG